MAFSGPLPPPSLLEKYEQTCPGSADRILTLWESQTAHRQGLENRALDSNISSTVRGQWLAFVVSLVVVGVAVWLISIGMDVQGLGLIIGEVVILAGIFLAGRKRQHRELAAKSAPIEQAARTVQYE